MSELRLPTPPSIKDGGLFLMKVFYIYIINHITDKQ